MYLNFHGAKTVKETLLQGKRKLGGRKAAPSNNTAPFTVIEKWREFKYTLMMNCKSLETAFICKYLAKADKNES